MLVALTRPPSKSLSSCELTYVNREAIDYDAALEQHDAYERCLESLGSRIERLPDLPDAPDAVFVEDTAVVFPEIAVIARPGTARRRKEVDSAAQVLGRYRPLEFIKPPATLEGGDVLIAGRDVYVGCSSRTNALGVRRLAEILEPYGYSVKSINVDYSLHLKTAACCIADDILLVNAEWVDYRFFRGMDIVPVHSDERFAANALRIASGIVISSSFPRTRRRLEQRGLQVCVVDVSEFEKAEGGVTCCSLLVEHVDGAE